MFGLYKRGRAMREQNQIGKMINYERNRAGLSLNELSKGLCSRAFLMRVETGERTCDKMIADALLQRAGVSADKFAYLLSPKEQQLLKLREQMMSAVEEGNRTAAPELIARYRRKAERKGKLHRQLLLLAQLMFDWKCGGSTEGLQEKLVEAWSITMEKSPMEDMVAGKKKDMGMTLTEFVLLMMYYRFLEEQGNLAQASEGYAWLLLHLERFAGAEDRSRLYPQLAYRRMQLLMREGKTEEAVRLSKKAVEQLQAEGKLFYLRKLLRFLLAYDTDTPERKAKLAEILEDISWVYEKYAIEEKEWIWNIPYGVANVEQFGDIIRARRKVLGLSQEELSEGICDPVTISRIEKGKVAPKKQVYQKLLERVGMTGDRFELTIQVERPELFAEADIACGLMTLGYNKEAEEILEELEKKMEGGDKFSMQYFKSLKATALYSQKKITPEEHSRLQEEALYLTVPKVSLEKLADWSVSFQEVRTINLLAHSYDRDGRRENGIALLEILKKQYEEKPFSLEYYVACYESIAGNLGNLLGNAGRYEEAIAISEKGIRLGMGAGRGVMVISSLYGVGWDMEQLWKTGAYTKEESLPYVKASYALSEIFEAEEQWEFYKKHLERLYSN